MLTQLYETQEVCVLRFALKSMSLFIAFLFYVFLVDIMHKDMDIKIKGRASKAALAPWVCGKINRPVY